MKKLIFLFMIAITMAAQGSSPVSSTRGILHETAGATYFTNYSNMENARVLNQEKIEENRKAPAEDEIEVPIEIAIDETKLDDAIIAFAIPSFMESAPTVYNVYLSNGKGSFILPKDIYDILILGYSQNCKESVILVYENVSIDKDSIIEGSFNDAQISVNIVPKSTDGTIIQASSEGKEGNIIDGVQLLETRWKEYYIPVAGFGNGIIGWLEMGTVIRTNQISENFRFTRIDQYGWTGGVTCMILPIDFSKDEISPNMLNWQTTNVNFCQTPFNINKKKVLDYDTLSMAFAFITNSNDFEYYGSIWDYGKFTALKFNENKIDLWCPEDYSSEYEMWVYPSGSCSAQVLKGIPAITGMPLRRSENGLCQVGFNPSDFLAYNCTSNGVHLGGNPRYSGEIQYTTLGNCAPILTTMPIRGVFDFTYTGRYGEDMQIDATGYPEEDVNWTEEQREALGLPSCKVAVNANGESFCNLIENWWNIWAYNGVFDAEISTDNILIDETVSGLSSAKIHYDSNIGYGTAPTLTYLQFRNNEDKVTDRLCSPADGFLEFYALAPIEKTWEKDGLLGSYFETGELESVKAEWSPMGQDNWKEIYLAEIPELFYMPGFGYCFRGYLNGVDKESDNKWYDLRVRVEDTYGAYQEQTISPAFRIESITGNGIQSIQASSNGISVYSIEGKTVMTNANESDLNNLPSGLYLVRNGNNTRKIGIP